MFNDQRLDETYPLLSRLADPLRASARALVGREREKTQVLASMSRAELCNALLLAPAGSGKTALVQGVALTDTERLYLEVDVSRMLTEAGTPEKMGAVLKAFFDQAEKFVSLEEQQLVLFMDEFHQIVALSSSAVEAIKPVLAASGARGIRIIAATTYEEYHEHLTKNQPLIERLQRINLSPPDRPTTVAILKGMAERYEVGAELVDDHMYQLIYDYTERYMPASSQPRKSILVLDSMVGWHRHTKMPLNRHLLADVLQESLNVNVAFTVDGRRIKKELDARVFSQDAATTIIAKRLQLAVADLHDPTKPMTSLLFAGSTGVGKSELSKQLAHLIFGDEQRHLIRFDMSEFAEENSLKVFQSEITKRISNMPHAVLLLDEVDKAAKNVMRVLLQVLDDGRLTDDHHREVSFLNTYIIMTTNEGSEIFATIAQYAADDTGSGTQLVQYEKLIRHSLATNGRFPPELLGRIDAIVPLQPLSLETQRRIIRAKLEKLVAEVSVKHNVEVVFDSRVLTYLVDEKVDTESNAGGARTAVSRLTNDVTTEIATFINQFPDVRRIAVSVAGQLASQDKNLLSSDARIIVAKLH